MCGKYEYVHYVDLIKPPSKINRYFWIFELSSTSVPKENFRNLD